jgi:hypothetical protein
VSRTEKVRIKSLAEDTRVVVANIVLQGSRDPVTQEAPEDSNESEDDLDSADLNGNETSAVARGMSRVYEKTIQILGDDLI